MYEAKIYNILDNVSEKKNTQLVWVQVLKTFLRLVFELQSSRTIIMWIVGKKVYFYKGYIKN